MNKESNETEMDDKPVIMSALLAEFNAMRSEIIFRATSQATLLQINITASGTVAVFALGDKSRALMMIILPILSPILGILWLDHDSSIMKLGSFIKTDLKSAYCRLVPSFDFPDYERYAAKADILPTPRFAILNFVIAVFATFGFLPLVALLYVIYQSWDDLYDYKFLAPIIVAALLLFTFFVQFVRRFGLPPLRWATSKQGGEPV